jgi:putative oxidoreductase
MIDQRTAPYAALLLRLALGTLFIVHLYWKFAVRGFDPWLNGLHDAGYSTPVVIYILSAEAAGALLLIPGVFTRWVSLYTLPLMLGAAQFWLARTGFWFTVAGAEFPLLWGVGLVAQALLGDGAYALGRARRRASRPDGAGATALPL